MNVSRNIRTVTLTALAFLYLFNIYFKVVQFLPTGRLVFLVLLILLNTRIVVAYAKYMNSHYIFLGTFSFAFIWVMGLYTVNPQSDIGPFNQLVVFSVYSCFMGLAFAILSKSLEVLLKAISYACLIQAVFVYISFYSETFRFAIAEILVAGGNIPLTFAGRVAGFSNGAGASLSLSLSMGVLCSMFLFTLKYRGVEKALMLVIAIITASSCILVGKTGLILSGYFIISLLLWSSLRVRLLTKKVICYINFKTLRTVTLFGFIVCIAIFLTSGTRKQESYALRRSFSNPFGEKDLTLKALSNMNIPPISLKTVLGTGELINSEGRSSAGTDIGYIRSYYCYGLILSLLLFLVIFGHFIAGILKIKTSEVAFPLWVLFIPLIIVECKEPFVFKVSYCFVLFAVIYAALKDQHRTHRSSL